MSDANYDLIIIGGGPAGYTAAIRAEIRRPVAAGPPGTEEPVSVCWAMSAMIPYVTDTPDIRIPANLLPADGRFGAGPSKVRTEAVEALAAAAGTYLGTSHRQKTVKSVVGSLRAGLDSLFGLPDGYEVVLGNGRVLRVPPGADLALVGQLAAALER